MILPKYQSVFVYRVVTIMSLSVLAAGKNCGFTSLIRSIDTEEKALNFFCDLGLINLRRAKCDCGNRFVVKNLDPSMKLGFRWRCISCELRFSPLRNTWFERSHLSLLQNLELLLHWFFRLPIELTIVDTGCPEHTVVDWRCFSREVCKVALAKNKRKIGGPGLIVEIDETHLFRRKHNRGHKIKGESVWIFGGMCRQTKERFVVRVPNRKKATLWPLLRKHVAPGSILMTDDFKSYSGLLQYRALGLGAHEVVVHKYGFKNPIFPEVYTNNTESIWRVLKKMVRRTGSNESIDLYIAEFLYRSRLDLDFGKRNFGPKLRQYLDHARRVYPGPGREGWKE